MTGSNDPWTPYQKSLLAIAVALSILCLIIQSLTAIRRYVDKSQDTLLTTKELMTPSSAFN
jgi:hypothetical protein